MSSGMALYPGKKDRVSIYCSAGVDKMGESVWGWASMALMLLESCSMTRV